MAEKALEDLLAMAQTSTKVSSMEAKNSKGKKSKKRMSTETEVSESPRMADTPKEPSKKGKTATLPAILAEVQQV